LGVRCQKKSSTKLYFHGQLNFLNFPPKEFLYKLLIALCISQNILYIQSVICDDIIQLYNT
jgi:hypothetical protein